MRKREVDLIGKKFGRLSVIEKGEVRGEYRHWVCICDCGKRVEIRHSHLITGNSTSCGCFRRERASEVNREHLQSKQNIYRTWRNIQSRCYNPNFPVYKYYGARGIQVCDRWRGKGGFNNFIQDMGPKPTPKHSIDRIDVNGNYEPGNCRWATQPEQIKNRRPRQKIAPSTIG